MTTDVVTTQGVPAGFGPTARPAGPGVGTIGVALASAAAFGTSGSFATALLQAGWTPGAAVTARIGLAALVLAPPTVFSLRGRRGLLRRKALPIVLYGLTGVAGCQLAYFYAVQHLSVGVALMLEYLSPVLLVLGFWAWTRQRPAVATLVGTVICIGGLMLVLDIFGDAHLSLTGVLWGLGAALGSAGYFIIAGRADDELPPLALAGAGMAAGAVSLGALGVVGILPMHASTQEATVTGRQLPFWIPLIALAVISTAFAYLTGVVAARGLGRTVASFVALAEVLFSVLFAWLLLGQLPLLIQLLGGVLIVGGVVLVRLGELRRR
ncbi:EamA family transporter [Flexivirga sp.]|uniref:EamA family transporter n=1 Tax=Flexivirga sp. TaxID=1962927 RepID=UPI003F81F213